MSAVLRVEQVSEFGLLNGGSHGEGGGLVVLCVLCVDED
jgi:hypothetical protein